MNCCLKGDLLLFILFTVWFITIWGGGRFSVNVYWHCRFRPENSLSKILANLQRIRRKPPRVGNSHQKVQVDQTLPLGRIGNPLYGSSQRLATLFGRHGLPGSTLLNLLWFNCSDRLVCIPEWIFQGPSFLGACSRERYSKSLRFLATRDPWPIHETGRYIYLHAWLNFMVHVGKYIKYTIHGYHGWYEIH